MIALLAGCSVLSFENDPPKLDAINGVEYHALLGGFPNDDPAFQATAGTDFAVHVDYHDSEGDQVQVWWPRAPAGWDFPPDATDGVWHVPADPLGVWGVTLLLADDDKNNQKTSEFYVPVHVPGQDSGYSYSVTY